MEGYYPSDGQVNRLSNLYNDTKRSTNFVQDQQSQDPEIKALHRKLKIQKDRLLSWGAEWSNPDVKADLDEDLSKAGLADLVRSVMSTIKEILAEAEPMWQSSLRTVAPQNPTAAAMAEAAAGDSKAPIVEWNVKHFEGLIEDLTLSIDTLFDLSRARSGGARKFDRSDPASGNTDLPGSSRSNTLKLTDPSTLLPLGMTGTPIAQSVTSLTDGIIIATEISQTATSSVARSGKPVLLQFTHISNLMRTTERDTLVEPLKEFCSKLAPPTSYSFSDTWSGLPKLSGYFFDEVNMRLGLLYDLPRDFAFCWVPPNTKTPVDPLMSLNDLLERPDFEPPLEIKFRMAHNIVNTVFDMHSRNIPHGALFDTSISFSACSGPGNSISEIDVRRPLLSGFEVYQAWMSNEHAAAGQADKTIYRHPLDPRASDQVPFFQLNDPRILDLYSLAVMLLCIGMWTKPENLAVEGAPSISESLVDQLAIRVGTRYMKAVKALWGAVDQQLGAQMASKTAPTIESIQNEVLKHLMVCSALDDGSVMPQLSESDSRPQVPERKPQKEKAPSSSRPGQYKGGNAARLKQIEAFGKIQEDMQSEADKPKKRTKIRLFNQVQAPLPEEIVDTWNQFMMHQINQALKLFYCKYPETVEISLESMGPAPTEAKPTVLVVCTSVSKVKAILKRKIGHMFDEKTGMGFRLKVCSGSMTRSQGPIDSSDSETPQNGGWQAVPENGASIGVWNGEKHLPPVTFGGMVMVDDKAYGLTVHHMLDDPDEADFGGTDALSYVDVGAELNTRSAARPQIARTRRPQARVPVVEGSVRRSSARRKPVPSSYRPPPGPSIGPSRGAPPPPPPKDNRIPDDVPPSLMPGTSFGSNSSGTGSCRPSIFAATQQRIQAKKEKIEGQFQHPKKWLNEQLQNTRIAQRLPRHHESTDIQRSSGRNSARVQYYSQQAEAQALQWMEEQLSKDLASAHHEPVMELSESDDSDVSLNDSDVDDLLTDVESDEESPRLEAVGDIPGIEAGFGEGMIITQPARDDADEDMFPCAETADEDHISTYWAGEVYASSGIRRFFKDGLVHEVDWALFTFPEGRQPELNKFPHYYIPSPDRIPPKLPPIVPDTVAGMRNLPGTEVLCMARTSGLQIGQILPSLASVKMAGRQSPAHSFQVTALPTAQVPKPPPIGLPGDSGAWVIDRRNGFVCGHVLAWSQRRRIAYICPMDITLLDIASVLKAKKVGLLGGRPIVNEREDIENDERLARQLAGVAL